MLLCLHLPAFVLVEQAGSEGSDVSTCADEEEDDSEQALEVKYG